MKSLLFAFLVTVSVAACATTPRMSDSERLALYRANAAAPVKSFHYFGRLDGWTPLGDSALAVWTRPNQAYLLELQGPCQDLAFANAISVTDQSGEVYQRFDKVIVLNRSAIPLPCFISQIRPLNVQAIKQAQRDIRDAGKMPEEAKPAASQAQVPGRSGQ